MSENYFMGLDGFVWFTGVVENRIDPAKLGRVQVRCLGFHTEDKTKLPTEDLPWAHVMHPVTDPSMQGMGKTPSFLVEGTWVVGFWRDAVDKQQPIIMGSIPGYPQSTADSTNGFSDPLGVYPRTTNPLSNHALDESDVNRLAKNDVGKQHKIVGDKELPFDAENFPKGRTTDVLSPTIKWSELSAGALTDAAVNAGQTRYGAIYPFNHVYESESGHVKEFDDTTNSERIHEYHRTGTFYEIDADGNKSTRIVGNNYEVVVGDEYVNIKGNVNLTIDGDLNTRIKGNVSTIIEGSETKVIRGESFTQVEKDVKEVYGSTQRTDVTGKVTQVYGKSISTEVTGRYDIDITPHDDDKDEDGNFDPDKSLTGEYDLEATLVNFNKTGSSSVSEPTSTINDPQKELEIFRPYIPDVGDTESGGEATASDSFTKNFKGAKTERNQSTEGVEKTESGPSVAPTPIANERYIGAWNNYDSDPDTQGQDTYIQKNNTDIFALKEQIEKKELTWNNDYWGLRAETTNGSFKRRLYFTEETARTLGTDLISFPNFNTRDVLDGAVVEPDYVPTHFIWKEGADRRIRGELGKIVDEIAEEWKLRYPVLGDFAFTATSGYRTISDNASVQGELRHRTGFAIDIRFGRGGGTVEGTTNKGYADVQKSEFVQLAIDKGILGIGAYFPNSDGAEFFHLDLISKVQWGGSGGRESQYSYLRDTFQTNGYLV